MNKKSVIFILIVLSQSVFGAPDKSLLILPKNGVVCKFDQFLNNFPETFKGSSSSDVSGLENIEFEVHQKILNNNSFGLTFNYKNIATNETVFLTFKPNRFSTPYNRRIEVALPKMIKRLSTVDNSPVVTMYKWGEDGIAWKAQIEIGFLRLGIPVGSDAGRINFNCFEM